jgi:hypothetical protein
MLANPQEDVRLQLQRRRWVRRPVRLEALCQLAHHVTGCPWHVRVLDLSFGGCALASSSYVRPGSQIRMGMFQDSVRLSDLIEGHVIYATRAEAGYWRIGCEFLRDLTAEEERRLL